MVDASKLYRDETTPAIPTDSGHEPPPPIAGERIAAKLYDAPKPVSVGPGEFYGYSLALDPWDRKAQELQDHGVSAAILGSDRDALLKAARAGVPQTILSVIADVLADTRIAETRPVLDPIAADHERNRRTADWGREAREALRATYGGDVDDLLARTNRYAQAFGLSRMLNDTGLGSRPDVVQELVHHVFITGYR